MRWPRKPRPRVSARRIDGRDRDVLVSALDELRPRVAQLTLYMCWHGGAGHHYPDGAMDAARRLRRRHRMVSGPDQEYTSLTFAPSEDDLRDFVEIAPYCDVAYFIDGNDEVLAEVNDDGRSASIHLPDRE